MNYKQTSFVEAGSASLMEAPSPITVTSSTKFTLHLLFVLGVPGLIFCI